mgnify:CR=1 FL=1
MVKRLPLKIFVETFKYVPRVALNLLVEDTEGRVLLAKRAIPPQIGSWHMPGSYLRKGEHLLDCLRRVARDELGLNLHEKLELVGVFEDIEWDPRGHIIDIVYKMKERGGKSFSPTTNQTKEVRLFDKLPSNIGFNHKDTLEKLGYR